MIKKLTQYAVILLCLAGIPNSGIFATSVVTQSTTFTADTSPAFQSMTNNPIIGLMIEVQGTGDDLSVTDISIDPSLCTNFTLDVSLVKVFYTGNDSTFSTGNLYWSGINLVQPLTGTQSLLPGKNYFWVTYNVAISAVAGDILDAACNSFTINYNAGNFIPDITSPEGYRIIETYYTIPRNISGRVYYDNAAETGLSYVIVMITDGYIQQQVIAGSNGQFQFLSLPPSTYYITVLCNKPWGGVNAVDALGILRHFVGTSPLSGIALMASDVDYNGYTNSSDGFAVLRRFTGLTSSFMAGDWVFEPSEVIIDGTHNVTHNIKGLCVGDVNKTHTP
ncbi:MAG: BNR-repeat neuraminidase N-terminal domain-containing protein [Bacteroidales bacterium]